MNFGFLTSFLKTSPSKHAARDKFGRNNRLSPEAWDERYRAGETGWDIARAAPPLVRCLAERRYHQDKSVLVPGCGRGHEARWLARAGARRVAAIDISELALQKARRQEPEVSAQIEWVRGDVRRMEDSIKGPFDLVVEHTCFCALAPADRAAYLDEIHDVLDPSGFFVGLFYVDFENPDGPPFGIFQNDLRLLLERSFEVLSWESLPADSAPERKDKEALVVARPMKGRS